LAETEAFQEPIDDFGTAFRLVGEFLYHFAQLEREIDLALGLLLRIDLGALEVVASNMDFMRKVTVLWAAEGLLAEEPEPDRKQLLKRTWSSITTLNEDRKMAAHSMFEPDEDGSGVVFRRVVTRQGLAISSVRWTVVDVSEKVRKINQTIQSLREIVHEMRPFEPSLDFSDPRNSALFGLM
jgi:hypothetical protein